MSACSAYRDAKHTFVELASCEFIFTIHHDSVCFAPDLPAMLSTNHEFMQCLSINAPHRVNRKSLMLHA